MIIKNWNIEAIRGYKPQTTFYTDFSIADNFGLTAIKDTFKRAFDSWKENHIYLTELVMALNWKIWEHYETNKRIAELYNELWQKADEYAVNNLKGEQLKYYYRTTD